MNISATSPIRHQHLESTVDMARQVLASQVKREHLQNGSYHQKQHYGLPCKVAIPVRVYCYS
jgi:hypothetical protein